MNKYHVICWGWGEALQSWGQRGDGQSHHDLSGWSRGGLVLGLEGHLVPEGHADVGYQRGHPLCLASWEQDVCSLGKTLSSGPSWF